MPPKTSSSRSSSSSSSSVSSSPSSCSSSRSLQTAPTSSVSASGTPKSRLSSCESSVSSSVSSSSMNSSGDDPLKLEEYTLQSLHRLADIVNPGILPQKKKKARPAPQKDPSPAVPSLNREQMISSSQIVSPVSTPSFFQSSRAIVVSGIPCQATDAQVTQELEALGAVRAFYLGQRSQGFVTVHYYDLRDAEKALLTIRAQHIHQQQRMQFALLCSLPNNNVSIQQEQPQHQAFDPKPYDPVKHELENVGFVVENSGVHQKKRFSPNPNAPEFVSIPAAAAIAYPAFYGGFNKHQDDDPLRGLELIDVTNGKGMIGGGPVWAHFYVQPVLENVVDGNNLGTLVVFNMPPQAPLDYIRRIFEVHGEIMDIRETPSKQHKFVEYFDVRHAAKAKEAVDGTQIYGSKIKVEYSRPKTRNSRKQNYFYHQPPATYYNYTYNPAPVVQFQTSATPASYYLDPTYYANLHYATGLQQHSFYSSTYNIGSGYYSYDRQFYGNQPYPWYSPDPSLPALPQGSMKAIVPNRTYENDGRNDYYRSKEPPILKYDPSIVKFEGEGGWSNRKSSKSVIKLRREDDHAHYIFNINDAEKRGHTTLMIRNLPNKYTLKTLLSVLDQHCVHFNENLDGSKDLQSAYDFVYLPVDFIYKCNLGYAFVNFTTIAAAIRLYEDFHNRRWEDYKSRKVCQVAYARLQGRSALEEHFRNSRFSCDTDDYLPLVFNPPRTGLQCPAPTRVSPPKGRASPSSSSSPSQSSTSERPTTSSEDFTTSSSEEQYDEYEYIDDEYDGPMSQVKECEEYEGYEDSEAYEEVEICSDNSNKVNQ